MPADSLPRPGLHFEGALHVSCGDFEFRLELTPARLVADFPSFGMLLRARKEGEELKTVIDRLPPLPPLPGPTRASPTGAGLGQVLADTEIFVAVNSRPVGKVTRENGAFRFRPTPLQFFKRLV
jgi:hypothetical protein